MPKVKGKVQKSGIRDGKCLALIELNGKYPKPGEIITVKWGATRSLPQNALLWVYYTWLVDHGGLKDHGFFCPESLHSSLKAHFLAEKVMDKGEFKAIEEGTTTTLNKNEFSEYMEKIDHFVQEFFGVDTSAFWEEHRENYQI